MSNVNKNKIAVIGLDCKFPGQSDGPDQFWETLLNKKDGIIPIPSDRWNHSYYYDAQGGKGKTFVDRAGFISDVFDFSPQTFGMSEKEAADIDPQQRLLIQSSWNSIQNAGYKIDSIKEKTGAFFGLSYRDYYDFDIAPNGVNGFTPANPLGTVNAIAAGRVAYLLGLNGPAIQLDTICSSSLMTLHLACQSLLNKECDYALSGGVNCILSPHALVALAQMGALSKSAKCQAFSKHADGYIRGEGVGVLLLKRLEDAERDGDYIYGTVEATATNHDGRSNGLTAPNGKAQVKLIEFCLEKAGLSPEDIGYIEAHGTGTYLGDPVELEGLNQVFGASRSPLNLLYVGSVKSNIGHLEPAAGVASLIKSLLILKNNYIPAGLHLEELNPGFKWNEKPIEPVKENRAWESDEKFIGVSAFSMTGANVHAILGKAPEQTEIYSTDVSAMKWPILISAQNETTLKQYISSLLNSINQNTSIASLSNTFLNGREVFEESIYACFDTTEQLIQELEKHQNGLQNVFEKVSLKRKRKNNQVVLNIGNFTDFKPEYLQIWKKQKLFAPSLTKTDRILTNLLGKSLYELAAHPTTEMERKINNFSQAFIWSDTLVSVLKTDVLFNTSGEGDYLGAVFSELISFEESLLLFILENGLKRNQLLDKIRFRTENNHWDKSAKASNKEFWLDKKEDASAKAITLNILNDTTSLSITQTETVGQLPDFLLYSYAKGVEMEWTQLLGNELFKKVSLPPAPLATATYISESYKFNSRKDPANFQNAGKSNVIASILHHQLEHEQSNRKSFNSFFSPEQDLFIKDHLVNETYIFPGAGYLSMICEALFYLKKSHQIKLKNVQIFQPMSFSSLTEKREVKLDLTYETKNTEEPFSTSGSWEIKSRKDQEEWAIHIKGSFGIRSEAPLFQSEKTESTPNETNLTPVDTAVFYDSLNNWGVQYGPEFRLINQLQSDERSMKSVVKQDTATMNLFASPELLDACMHGLFSAKTFEHFSEPFVPSRYDEINFYQPLHGTIHASGILLKMESDAMNAQFSFCDPEGNILLEITSMEVRKILSEFLQSEKENETVYQEKWQKLDIVNNQQKANTDNQSASKDSWIFLNAEQAQQSFSEVIKTAVNVPQIALLGQESSTILDNSIGAFKDITELLKSLNNNEQQLILFAPPIEDIKGLSQMFTLFKDLLLNLPQNLNFRLCTIKGMAIHSEEQVNPFHTALWGLARTMPIEGKQKWKGVIDISSINEAPMLLDSQFKTILATHDQLALREKKFYTPILTTEIDSLSDNLQPKGDWANPVLITGGLGQMGRVFTEQLVQLGCKKIYLLSRNPAWLEIEDSQTDNFNLSQSQLEFREYIKKCEAKGISISAVSGKVDSNEDMAAIAALLKKQGIDAINLIHAAGAVTRNKVVDATSEELETEWKAKYEGAIQLDKHFGPFNVGFTLYTSSIASLWSGEGVAGYSSANLLLDGLAVNRNLEGKRTLSVRFGRFAEKGLMKEHEAQELETLGILTLPMYAAVDNALELAEKSTLTTPSIMQVDWQRFSSLYQLLNRNQFLSLLAHKNTTSEGNAEPNFSYSPDKPLQEVIKELVAEELEIDIHDVDSTIPLFELGLDSVDSLSIRTTLEKLLKIKLSVSLIYDYNTVDLLSKHLEELTQKVSDPTVESKKEKSEEELLQLLLEELN
ncbi:beta-ketoacyl synthase N-terminal-like domain-containing protein [Flavobacterium sp. Fl-318]|uniref:Beta-ketoacyl synthase N-terminal-like domain-containing protein n=1 Tax=Flavobacterium cupriresistens TaxID=2893885 RepID=A0ABU4RAT1_9FLAO|nr:MULTISPECIES: beta-ketoacyl synthase N-terminal-like domain-containing protein [unclassified Flavobacterium]MDX6189698.1 beta-ketoacyl synthase N-terminal-like domain-containing protein [Flavobacterium sp. Fl-318]UFH40896.1 polyketide synthase dehydratase domain-containing protein [Flavobacterium sp. F-323]